MDESKQKTILNTISIKLFDILTKNKVILESSGFVPRDKHYENPYKQEKKKHKRFEELPEPKKKEKKKIKKGPRMSHG